MKIFVSVTSHKKSNQTKFVRLVARQNFVAETKFLQKSSSTQEVVCLCDMLP